MQAIVFALISFLGWGVGDIFGTIASRKIGGYSTTFWYIILQIPLFGIFAFFFFDKIEFFTPQILLLNFFLSIVGTIGLVTFYEGLRVANASLVGTISASFAAVTVALSIVFLGETLSTPQLAAVLIIFLGIIVSTLEFKEIKKGKIFTDKGILLALVTMIAWGVYWTFIKIPIQEIGWYWPAFISVISSVIPLSLFIQLRKIRLEKINHKGSFLSLFLNATLLGAGALSFNFAIQEGLASIVAPIAGSYPVLFVFLSFLIFKDKITRQQILGIITTLTGIVLLSILSV